MLEFEPEKIFWLPLMDQITHGKYLEIFKQRGEIQARSTSHICFALEIKVFRKVAISLGSTVI